MRRTLLVLLVACVIVAIAVWASETGWERVQRAVWTDRCDHPLPPCLASPRQWEMWAANVPPQDPRWGGAHRDGPDRCMPLSCVWEGGVLRCSW